MQDSKTGPAREHVDVTEEDVKELRDAGALVMDTGRRRPLYFDGRFLAASDLTLEQEYFLSRQAQLGQSLGSGIVNGLEIMEDSADARSVTIKQGHGVTTNGHLVLLSEDLSVNLSDVAEAQRLNVAFGLSEIPKASSQNRTGLFIIGLRPVEYTANDIAAYPTSVTGKPVSHTNSSATGEVITQHGDVVSAVAVTVVPYKDLGNASELLIRRATAAREIFVDASDKAKSASVLPLAMLAMESGIVRWIDMHMVRRLVGNEHRDILGLGFSPRGLREAYVRQYQSHLRYLIENTNQLSTKRMVASDYFFSLPACGPMPSSSINTEDFTQSFFPSDMEADISIIPEDELPALIEESLLLPPIDLTFSGEELESTSIMVLIPVSRQELRQLSSELVSVHRSLRTVAPGQKARRKPLEALRALTTDKYKTPSLFEGVLGDDLWRTLLTNNEELWFIRRRNLSYKAEIASVPVPGTGTGSDTGTGNGGGDTGGGSGGDTGGNTPPGDTGGGGNTGNDVLIDLPGSVIEKIKEMKLEEPVKAIYESANAVTRESVSEFLSLDSFNSAPNVMLYSAIDELASTLQPGILNRSTSGNNMTGLASLSNTKNDLLKNKIRAINEELVKTIRAEFRYENMGKGVFKLEKSNDKLKGDVYLSNLGRSGRVTEFDKLLMTTDLEEKTKVILEEIVSILLDKKADQHLVVAELIDKALSTVKSGDGGIKDVPITGDKSNTKPSTKPVSPADNKNEIVKPAPGDDSAGVISIGGNKPVKPVVGGSDDIVIGGTNKPLAGGNPVISGGVINRDADADNPERVLAARLDSLGLTKDWNNLQKLATRTILPVLKAFMFSEQIIRSDNLILMAVIKELSLAAKKNNNKLTKRAYEGIQKAYGGDKVGSGIRRIYKTSPALSTDTSWQNVIATAGIVYELDLLAQNIDQVAELRDLIDEIQKIVNSSSKNKRKLLSEFLTKYLGSHGLKARV